MLGVLDLAARGAGFLRRRENGYLRKMLEETSGNE